LFAAVAASAPAVAQVSLFGVATYSNFGVQSLYSIDASSGAATLVGSTGLRQIAGLDWDEVNNRLVALTVGGDRYSLSTSTGASSMLAEGGFGVPEGSLAMVEGTAFTTIFDELNAWNGSAWQSRGASGLAAGSDISGLDVANGRLLGLALNGTGPDQLVAFDSATGAASIIGLTGTNASTVAGLATLGSRGYMTDGGSLYAIDTLTGGATLIGAHGVAGFSGLAIVPTPGSALVLAAAIGIGGRRRRV
jgi:hypothetical protein